MALGAAALAAGAHAAGPGGRDPPSENTPSAEVHPFPTGDPQQISTGEWVVHRVGWVAPSRAAIEDFRAKVELQAWVDGEPVGDDSNWGDPYQEDGDWYVMWRYATPPKSPGVYTFRARFEFTEALNDGSREPGDVDDITGTYEVSGGGEGRGKGK